MACAALIGGAGLLYPPIAPIAEPAAVATGITGALMWIVGGIINWLF
jgi:hypothetical protein